MLKAVAGGSGSGGGGITPGTTVITGGTNTRVLFDDNGVLGESAGLTFTKGNAGTTSLLFIGGATVNLNSPSSGVLAVGTTAANALGSLNLNNLTATGQLQTSGSLFLTATNSALQLNDAAALYFSTRAVLRSTADAEFSLRNNAETAITTLYIPATGTLQLGRADVASGTVAQTLQVQSNTGATTTGPLFLIKGAGGGTGAGSIGGEVRIQGGLTAAAGTGGAISFYTAASGAGATPVLALTLSSAQLATFAGQVVITNVTSDAAATDTTACLDTTSKQIKSGSGTLGICLGTSGRQFKTDFAPMTAGLNELMQLPLYNYHYLPGHGDGGKRQQYGLTAQDVEKVMPVLAGHNADGETINYDYGALLFVSIKAIQELEGKVRDVPVLLEAIRDQQIMIDELQNRLDVH